MIREKSSQRNTREGQSFRQQLYGYSLLMKEDCLGWGYHVQETIYNSDAMDEGWVLIAAGLREDEAADMRDDLRDIEYARTWADEVVL